MIDNKHSADEKNNQGDEVNELLQKKEFGSKLRNARKAAGLTVNEIAEKLLISVDIIKALENSQVDNLPASTFTQGYIRSYARLLDLPADELIEAYVDMVPSLHKPLTPHSPLAAQTSSSDAFIKMISLVLLLVALSVLFYWVFQTDFSKQTVTENTEIKSSLAENNRLSIQTSVSEIDNAPWDAAVTEVQSEPVLNSVNAESDSDIVDTAPDTSVDNSPVASVATQTSDNREAAPLHEASDEIVLAAINDSWVEIQDATGKRLYYQLLKKSEEIKLTGAAPFSVFLGNAPDVRLEINHKIVDFDHLIRANGKTARILLQADATVSRTRQ